jgi:D-tagatose-1,6-bisphosphate aldolase subunit GatZ/KbaZ
MHILQRIANENKIGRHAGVYSCCSANGDVIKAVLLKAKLQDTIALIESTSNQVNQFGGYTDMTPEDFRIFTFGLAQDVGIDHKLIILGGDHLGPLPWADLPEAEAMANAEELIRQCVLAGFSKIHLDTSMRLGDDDPSQPLETATCAARGARLCAVAEAAYAELLETDPTAPQPIYVIGSEVPVPGGDFDHVECPVTRPEDCLETIAVYQRVFEQAGLGEVFERVVGLVVQLGVEFAERHLDEYDRTKTADLVTGMRKSPIVFEGHSTDYQTPENLRRMCEDGVAILKVGPALTFALREALFALEIIEQELYPHEPNRQSRFRETLEEVMLADDKSWRSYYTGDEEHMRISRAYSYYDRCRYYLPDPRVRAAHDRLIQNLSGNVIPPCMLSQYLPNQFMRVRSGELRNEPEPIILDKIGDCIDSYLAATSHNGMPEGYDHFLAQQASA